jgi:ubiquitin conjugation factor E4 B
VLVGSGNIMDRASIEQHLLNNETDPFNRAPLKAEDLIPQPELQARIEAWIDEQRKSRASAQQS